MATKVSTKTTTKPAAKKATTAKKPAEKKQAPKAVFSETNDSEVVKRLEAEVERLHDLNVEISQGRTKALEEAKKSKDKLTMVNLEVENVLAKNGDLKARLQKTEKELEEARAKSQDPSIAEELHAVKRENAKLRAEVTHTSVMLAKQGQAYKAQIDRLPTFVKRMFGIN